MLYTRRKNYIHTRKNEIELEKKKDGKIIQKFHQKNPN